MSLYVGGREVTEADLAHALSNLAANDPSLPQDRHDPEREWCFPAFVSGPGSRSVGVVEWEGRARTHYPIYLNRGIGYVRDTWISSGYPKDQWSEEEARACHEQRKEKS